MSEQLHQVETSPERDDTPRQIRRYAREAHRHLSQGLQQASAIAENALHTMQDTPTHEDHSGIARALDAICARLDQCCSDTWGAVDGADSTYKSAQQAERVKQEAAGQPAAAQGTDLIGGEPHKLHHAALQLAQVTKATCEQLDAIAQDAACVLADAGLHWPERIANVLAAIRDLSHYRQEEADDIAYGAGFAYEDEAQQQRMRASVLASARKQRHVGEA